MPIYDYSCAKCNIEIEVEHSMHDKSVILCTNCLGPTKRLISKGTTFTLVGGGWAADNYSKSSVKQTS